MSEELTFTPGLYRNKISKQVRHYELSATGNRAYYRSRNQLGRSIVVHIDITKLLKFYERVEDA